MMPNLDRVVKLQVGVQGIGGDPTAINWATTAEVWAQRLDRVGLERYVASVEIETVDAAFMIRYREDISAAWRIVDDNGDVWDVQGVLETERRRWQLVTVRRTGPGGR